MIILLYNIFLSENFSKLNLSTLSILTNAIVQSNHIRMTLILLHEHVEKERDLMSQNERIRMMSMSNKIPTHYTLYCSIISTKKIDFIEIDSSHNFKEEDQLIEKSKKHP